MPTILGAGSECGGVLVRWLEGREEKAALFTDEFFLGRGSDCRVRFYDPLVSRRHARIHHEDGHWRIEDLGSRNGTIVGDRKVEQALLGATSQVRLNEAGPVLRLEVLPPGEEMRAALTRYARGPMVAHVRSPALEAGSARGSGTRQTR
jgi:pSer/pThr/pTyr-binding forkhead associated (FHA) protein